MTTTEYRAKLVEQFNQTSSTLEQLRGAIAACNELIAAEDEALVPTDEETESDD